MGQRANLVIVQNGVYELYYSHWHANTLPDDLFWGPEHAAAFIAMQQRREADGWLDDVWAEGGAVMDLDTRTLLLYGGEDLCYDLPLRRVYMELLRYTWPSWTLRWAYEGIAEMAAFVGYPVQAVLNPRERGTEIPDFRPPEQQNWIDLIGSIRYADGQIRLFPMEARIGDVLDAGPAVLAGADPLIGADRFAPIEAMETFPTAGFHLDVPQRRLDYWHADDLPGGLDRFRQAWTGWEIADHQGEYEVQLRLAEGRLELPALKQEVLLKKLERSLVTTSSSNPADSIRFLTERLAKDGKNVQVNPNALRYDQKELTEEMKRAIWEDALGKYLRGSAQ